MIACGVHGAPPGESIRDAGAEFELQLSRELRDAAPEPSEQERDILRQEYRLRGAMHEQGASALELAARLKEMEEAVRALAAVGASKAAAPAPVPAPALQSPAPAARSPAGWRVGIAIAAGVGLGGLLLLMRRRRAAMPDFALTEPRADAAPARPMARPTGSAAGSRKAEGALGVPTHSLDFSLGPESGKRPGQ